MCGVFFIHSVDIQSNNVFFLDRLTNRSKVNHMLLPDVVTTYFVHFHCMMIHPGRLKAYNGMHFRCKLIKFQNGFTL